MGTKTPIGLTGGIASGKSTVMKMFRDLGARGISGDAVAADVLSAGSQALNALVREFGSGILSDDGSLDRRVMLDMLLEKPSRMQRQLDILAPFILPEIDQRVSVEMQKSSRSLLIVEAPLLFEYGHPERYAPIIVVTVPRDIQVQRLMLRSGRSRQWAEAVIDLQWPLPQKEHAADYVISNAGTVAATQRQVSTVYTRLTRRTE
ncbi:MAG TPA: dephospho-CoA kinase [bacterium]|nr:dephospho-CoA kinase [bacterium]